MKALEFAAVSRGGSPPAFLAFAWLRGFRGSSLSLSLVRIIPRLMRASSSFVLFSRAFGGWDFSCLSPKGARRKPLPSPPGWPTGSPCVLLGSGERQVPPGRRPRSIVGGPIFPFLCLAYSCRFGASFSMSNSASSFCLLALSSAASEAGKPVVAKGWYLGAAAPGFEKPLPFVRSSAALAVLPSYEINLPF